MKKRLKRWLVPACAAMLSLAAAIPAFADETVSVTVPNVRGGYLEVSYMKEDGTTVYLPIGEKSQVPKGQILEINVCPLDYELDDTTSYYSFACSVKANGEELEDAADVYYAELEAEEDTELDVIFKGNEETYEPVDDGTEFVSTMRNLRFENEEGVYNTYTGMMEAGILPPKQLTLTLGKKNFGFSEVTSIEIERVNFFSEEGEYENITDQELFCVDETGILTAEEPLEKGRYRISFKFDTDRNGGRRGNLTVYVGPQVFVDYSLARYKYAASDSYAELESANSRLVPVKNMNTDTFKDIFDRYMERDGKIEIANYPTATGLGTYNAKTNSYSSIMNAKVGLRITKEYQPFTYADIMLSGFKPALIEPLNASDIVPDQVEPGWNLLHGKWYYFENEDPESLVTEKWLPCREGDGEEVWAGADGTLVTDSIVKADGKSYLVDEKGHKRKDTVTAIDGTDYVTDSDGVIIETKLSLATPSNAEKIMDHVDKVLENQDSMSKEDKQRAADMLTEALTEKADITKMTASEIAKYEEVYKAAYGAENIILEPEDVAGGIAAAGLTSADFVNGAATIQYVTEWLGTSSNAQETVSVKLYVNGVERKKLTAPITITIDEMPDTFIASYSNASYNYSIDGASNVTVDTENGTVKLTITRTGSFGIKAVLKNTYRPSSSGKSSSGSGRATVKADYTKNGKWMLDQTGWWFQYDDGTWPAKQWAYLPWNNEHKWYYFNADGYMITGWHYWQNNYYYLYPTADGNRGYMFTGWHEIGGKWYYFSANNDAFMGAMAYNTTTPDGYKVNADGEWIQ